MLAAGYNAIIQFSSLQVETGDAKVGLETQLAKVVRERDVYQSEVVNLKIEVNTNNDRVSYFCLTNYELIDKPLNQISEQPID